MRAYTPPPHLGLDILYIDEDFVVLNKPSGLLSVPGRSEENKDSLASRVQLEFPEATIVHRLDMDTSGIMAMARNKAAHVAISRQFEQKETEKAYTAVLFGSVEGDTGKVDLPMRCDWPNRPRQIVDFEQGKSAQTLWQVIQRSEETTRVLLTPITGRSHQLRVHMQALGYPIMGDPFYAEGDARDKVDRLLLHATELSFTHHISGKKITIESDVPF